MNDDKRLIEDYLPIEAISAEASREKSVRKGHISTLHLWWARRPLVACRAAVYGALVPASQFVPNGGSDAQNKSLGRANAAKFINRLCRYPSDSKPEQKADIERAVKEAQQHILKAHAKRLSTERGKTITVEDIAAGRAPRPRVLDMFAGGGAIPLEALRLGCETYALDLNPVAYIIELCTLVYPQKYGKPDSSTRGMTGPRNKKGETTWGGLAQEVRYWGNWVLQKVKAEIGDLYPLIPDTEFKSTCMGGTQADLAGVASAKEGVPPGYLMPVAYLWTRTVPCKNPRCRATVPLVRRTWLATKEHRYVALKVVAPKGERKVHFEVVEGRSENSLGFDPDAFSKGGNATCPFCGTVADTGHIKAEAQNGGLGNQLLAVACSNPRGSGNIFLTETQVQEFFLAEEAVEKQARHLMDKGFVFPQELISGKGADQLPAYGMTRFSDVFLKRPLVLLGTTATIIRTELAAELTQDGYNSDHAMAVRVSLGLALDRIANYLSTMCVWRSNRSCVLPTFSRQALSMTWDFGEMNPFAGTAGDFTESVQWVADVLDELASCLCFGEVFRGSADQIPAKDGEFDAVITDPPYYDNVIYSDLSDFFYVWLHRSVGDLFPQHFASDLTPKKREAVSARFRHSSVGEARQFYEEMMLRAFAEANRVLKPGGSLCCVYAHKTTLGWATLVDALRRAGFLVTEAWPVNTEMTGGMRVGTAALASSIFLIARKRDGAAVGRYEEEVRLELEAIVRERVGTLWDMGISGADLVIACVGAGLRAFTRFARVEYANGEEVPAERFLTEVETVVLETILSRLSKEVGAKGGAQYSLASLDTTSRFYVLWRYTYGAAELDAGEAIIFANGTHVELDGQYGLTGGNDALVEKKKSKYRLRDYAERGKNDKLGLPTENGQAVPLIDMLHRTLWLMENRPAEMAAFLTEALPNREQLRLVAQALAGPALKGGEMGDISPTVELSALGKLTANWQSVIENAALTIGEREEKKTGQTQLL